MKQNEFASGTTKIGNSPLEVLREAIEKNIYDRVFRRGNKETYKNTVLAAAKDAVKAVGQDVISQCARPVFNNAGFQTGKVVKMYFREGIMPDERMWDKMESFEGDIQLGRVWVEIQLGGGVKLDRYDIQSCTL